MAQSSTPGLGNLVWQDTNANGLQNPGEPGIAGLTLNLYDTNNIPVLCVQEQTRYYLDTGNSATDSQGDLTWNETWSFTNASSTTEVTPAIRLR